MLKTSEVYVSIIEVSNLSSMAFFMLYCASFTLSPVISSAIMFCVAHDISGISRFISLPKLNSGTLSAVFSVSLSASTVSVFVCAVEASDSGEMLSLPVSDAAHEPSKKTKADKRKMYLFFIISNYPFL